MDEVVTMTEAAHRLGVSRVKIRALVKEGVLPAMTNPLDKRERLIPVSAIEQLEGQVRHITTLQPRTIAGSAPPMGTAGLDRTQLPGDKR